MRIKKHIAVFFLLQVYFLVNGQDSLPKLKIKLFDLTFCANGLLSESNLNYKEITSFTKNERFLNESKGYSQKENPYQDYYDLGDFGLGISFKFQNTQNKVLKRMKLRAGLHYCTRIFSFDDLSYNRTYSIDTLYFTNPSVPPLLIDSVSGGSLTYKYSTHQLLFELGANIDIITLRYFNFYAGILYGQGIGIQNEFSVHKYEYYSVDRYPGQTTTNSAVTADYTLKESGPKCLLSRLIIPIGVQHRFRQKRNFSPGFFGEFRPGFEAYKIVGGSTVSRFVFSVSGGIRLSFQKHK